MMRRVLLAGMMTATLGLGAVLAQQPASPPEKATVTVGRATLTIDYSAPSVRGRKIFGAGGLLSGDPTYPVWRAGANSATAFHTDADLAIGSGASALTVPKGDYTLFVDVSNPDAWILVVNKQTGQWGLDADGQRLERGDAAARLGAARRHRAHRDQVTRVPVRLPARDRVHAAG
jgi:hypothetical protein